MVGRDDAIYCQYTGSTWDMRSSTDSNVEPCCCGTFPVVAMRVMAGELPVNGGGVLEGAGSGVMGEPGAECQDMTWSQ